MAENGLLGKIEFNSEMTAKDTRLEVCKVFVSPMGLSEDDIREGKTEKFRFLQRTGAGSRTFCVPSVAEEFEWNARHVSTLAKSGGIIYVQAVDELIGLEVSSAYNKYVISYTMTLRVPAHRKYGRPRSRPHLIDHIFGARITLILLFARLFCKVDLKNTIRRLDLPKMKNDDRARRRYSSLNYRH